MYRYLWLLLISTTGPLKNDLNEFLWNQGTSVSEHSFIPWEPTHNSQWSVCVYVCLCDFKRGISDSLLSILWHKLEMTNLFQSLCLSDCLSLTHTYINKQKDTGLSCSIVVSGRLCTWVEASSGLLLNWMWLLSNSPVLCVSACHLPDNTLSLSLWEEEQTICSSRQITPLKWFDFRPHTSMPLLS